MTLVSVWKEESRASVLCRRGHKITCAPVLLCAHIPTTNSSSPCVPTSCGYAVLFGRVWVTCLGVCLTLVLLGTALFALFWNVSIIHNFALASYSGILLQSETTIWGHGMGNASVIFFAGAMLLVPRTFLLSPAKIFFGMELPAVVGAHALLVCIYEKYLFLSRISHLASLYIPLFFSLSFHPTSSLTEKPSCHLKRDCFQCRRSGSIAGSFGSRLHGTTSFPRWRSWRKQQRKREVGSLLSSPKALLRCLRALVQTLTR